MGVPNFYRWLTERYPAIVQNIDKSTCLEFDNLYIDMNGIIHKCSYSTEDIDSCLSEKEIFQKIFNYVEHIFNLVAPKKVLFLAVDGVAPRTKMNQQRARRYQAAQDAAEKRKSALGSNETSQEAPRFDSNCITPGTEFMEKLHEHLLVNLFRSVQINPAWKNVEIIYSGFDVPGEGEHKIMDYIRTCKAFDLNQEQLVRHCLYSLDSDLINLGLCSHEPFFSILREERKSSKTPKTDVNFQLLHLSILRDYLEAEFNELKTSLKNFSFSLKNIIDDWILMISLIGNDFLPLLPTFSIEEDSLEKLYKTYLLVLPTLSGYMNIDGNIQLDRFRTFLQVLAGQDLAMFKKTLPKENNTSIFGFRTCALFEQTRAFDFYSFRPDVSTFCPTVSDESKFAHHKKCYYEEKNLQAVHVSNEYVRGLQWILTYYYRGCPSWNWCYCGFDAPYISDLCDFTLEKIEFEASSTPFPPIVQLLAVLPISSQSLLPQCFRNIVVSSVFPLTELTSEKDDQTLILMPFFEENVLMLMYEKLKNSLTDSEMQRNRVGCHLSLKHSKQVQLNQGKYPNVKYVEYVWDAFILPSQHIIFGMRSNVRSSLANRHPSLKGVSYIPELQDANIILQIINVEYSPGILMNIIQESENRTIHINWPFVSEAKLIGIITESHKYSRENNQIEFRRSTKEDWALAVREATSYAFKLVQSRVIHSYNPKTVAIVQSFECERFIVRGSNATLERTWHQSLIYLPLELLDFSSPQFKTVSVNKPLDSVFFPGEEFFVLARQFYGMKARVVEYRSNNQLQMEVSSVSQPTFSSIQEKQIINQQFLSENAFLTEASRKLKVSRQFIRKIIGSIIVEISFGSRQTKFNLGLKLRYQRKSIPGFVLVDDSQSLYHHRCLTILQAYHIKFSKFLSGFNPKSSSNMNLTNILPAMTTEEKTQHLIDLKNWLDTLDHIKVGHVEPTSEFIDTTVVNEIKNIVESFVAVTVTETVTLSPEDLFVPEFVVRGRTLPDSRVTFHLYDRVVNINQRSNVKFGEKGTVIQIHRLKDSKSTQDSTIGVLFDTPVENGINYRSSTGNCVLMSPFELLNISFGAIN